MPTFLMTPPQDTRKYTWAERLQGTLPQYQMLLPETDEDFRSQVEHADAAYGWIPPDILPFASKLRWLQAHAAGPQPGYYYKELVEHPVTVCNLRGIYNDCLSQHILMFLFALARGLPDYMEAQRQRQWSPQASRHPIVHLAGATALIVGVGGIGHETARLCAELGMTVLGVDARWEYDVPYVQKHSPDELDMLLPRADFVIATTPHTPHTEGMWHKARFARMKPSAYFINVGRGKTMKMDDLVDAVAEDVIAGCGLDVFEVEPLPSDHRLWTLPNVLLTPHIAIKDAADIPERQFQLLLENARRFAVGEPLLNVVDKAVWY